MRSPIYADHNTCICPLDAFRHSIPQSRDRTVLYVDRVVTAYGLYISNRKGLYGIF